MRNSLIFKLMGAFLLVIAIGALVISWLVSQATRSAFNLYTTRNGQAWAQRLAPVLADFYSRDGSWQGVDVVLQSGLSSLNPSGGMGYGNGQGQGRGMGFGRGSTGSSMGGMMAQRMILADGQGVVISDTQDELNGKQLSSAETKNGTPVIVNDNLVGTLIVTPNDFAGPATPAGEFLASVNQSIITAIIIASIIALILGAVLFLQITAPLRQLKKASVAIAGGDLSQRVTIYSRDELGELGQAFNHMAESLADAETQRQHLVADVAHELRTPLAAIQATAEGMLDGVLPLDEEQVASIHTETLLLNRLIGDLRLLSLAEAGQLKLERQEINLGGLVSQIVERSKPQAMQKDVTLGAEVQKNLPPVWIDSDRITQVLNNLIGNALRYTPKDGTITVGIAPAPGLTNTVKVSVTDTGPGIDPEALPFVFDRFYRSDKSRSRASGGSGLGLAIVKQLVEAHGGKVEAVSPVFRSADHQEYGTRISFTLPNA
jgi:two-component system OmpR family sensor kinase/two-component system sensor histidine kinase BaeS